MDDLSPRELELTPDLLEYARCVALKEAQDQCPKYVVYDDVVQEVLLHLISKPPKYDPAKGASEKTLIHTIVHRAVLKYVARQRGHGKRFAQIEEPQPGASEDNAKAGPPRRDTVERRPVDLTTKSSTTDDILEYIDSEESRALCRLVIQCQGNFSEAARRLGVTEGTVRYRLKVLAPKLIAAGFDPLKKEEFQ